MKYGPEITSELCQYLKNGSSREDAVIMAGVDRSTFYEWMKQRPDFADAIKKAEAVCKARNIQIIQKAAITTWTAAAWWLERKYPNEFSIRPRMLEEEGDAVPQRMAKRAAELLKKLEGGENVRASTNGNGLHP